MELGFRIQSLEGFRIPGAVFRILKPEISDSTAKISRIPESGYPLRGAMSSPKQATDPTLYSCNCTNGKFVIEPLKSTCWIISCWLSDTQFCRSTTKDCPLVKFKIQTRETLRCSRKTPHWLTSFKDLWRLSNKIRLFPFTDNSIFPFDNDFAYLWHVRVDNSLYSPLCLAISSSLKWDALFC